MVILLLNGQPAVQIADHKGVMQTYVVERLECKSGERLFRLLRQGDDAIYSYEVRFARGWSCNCKSFRFNPKRKITGCKHTKALAELAVMFRLISQDRSPICHTGGSLGKVASSS